MNMKKKIIGILVCTLLIAAAVLPVAGTVNNSEISNDISNENIIEDQTFVESEPQQHYVVSGDEWPMFLHDLENTGYSTSTAPDTNTIKWIYHIEDGFGCESSPAIVNGKVYIGTEIYSSGSSSVYCLDADTGEALWTYDIPEDSAAISSCSPAVYEGKVYIGESVAYFYCLDADTGALIWKFYKGLGISKSPAVVDGRVYIAKRSKGGEDGCLYCLDADTGQKLWDYNTGESSDMSSPAVYDNKVYTCSENTNLYCFDADTGDKLWEYDTGDMKVHFSHPTVFDGRVYCGGSRLNCVDAETGEEIWHLDERVWVSPAVAYGNVYFCDESNGFYCLDADTGEEIWFYPEGSGTWGSCPAVADGKVYTGAVQTGELICLNAETGEKLWDYQTNQPGTMFNSPAVAYGRVYMGGRNYVYCFEDSLPPDPPTIDGPTAGTPNRSYSYTIQATDPEGNDIYYYVDWGDDTNTSWLGPYSSGEEITLRHEWTEVDTYILRAQAKDTFDFKSPWSELDVGISNPPSAPTIDGPTSVKKGTKYDYTFNSVDPDGDDVYYIVVWGQPGDDELVGPYPSGETITLNHTWNKVGEFTIKAKAKDSYGVEGDWGYLEVTVPKSKIKVVVDSPLFLQQFPNAFPLLRQMMGV